MGGRGRLGDCPSASLFSWPKSSALAENNDGGNSCESMWNEVFFGFSKRLNVNVRSFRPFERSVGWSSFDVVGSITNTAWHSAKKRVAVIAFTIYTTTPPSPPPHPKPPTPPLIITQSPGLRAIVFINAFLDEFMLERILCAMTKDKFETPFSRKIHAHT